MKILIFLIIITFSSFTHSLENIKYRVYTESSVPFDRVYIYELQSFKIAKKIEFFSDREKTQSSGIVIDKEYVLFKTKSYYKDYNDCLLEKPCSFNISNIDFLSKDEKGIVLKIEKYEEGNGIVTQEGKKLYFSIGKDFFKKGTDYRWRSYVFPNEKEKKIEDFNQDIILLKDVLREIEVCSRLKDFECLKKYARNPEGVNADIAKARDIFENKKLCNQFLKDLEKNDGLISFSSQLLAKANEKNDIFWNALIVASKFDQEKSYIIVRVEDFNNIIMINIKNKVPKKMACDNVEDLQISFVKVNNKWMISSISSYGILI